MSLGPGTKIGQYEVVAPIGHGAMGEVYRAHDTKLGRDVALKVLPDSFANDAERLARFRREAQILASLNHPHIAAIYGLEESPTKSLVLELVEGPTLADRIAHGPMPIDEAWPIARQIAQALEAAHEQGIVHRDLKPANIKVRDDGTVKVLDFGLAKGMEPPTGDDAAQSPTITSPAMTQVGVLLGTAAYMSPEIAKGRPADKRGDIWAFGCVLFEMLAGRRPFDGNDMTEVLGAIVRLEPDWQSLPDTIPPAVVSALKRCLQKDRTLRLRHIADARFQIEDVLATPALSVPRTTPSRRIAMYASWAVTTLATIVAGVVIFRDGGSPAAPPETRLQIVTPPADDPLSLAISPDGRSVVFQARENGPPQLWLRSLESEVARPLMGTDHGALPFWSPDSRSVGFFADGLLKRIDLASGFVRTLATATGRTSGAWSSEGTILFGLGSVGPLYSVPPEGGVAIQATNLLPGQTNHRWPQFLPGGRRFLLFALGTPAVRGVYLASLDDKDVRRVVDTESAYAFRPPAHVLLARQGGLWARRLDPEYTGVSGELIPIAPRVLLHTVRNGYGAFSSSLVGSIAFRSSGVSAQLAWVDREGRTVGVVGEPDNTQMGPPVARLSPDERTVAFQRMVNGNTDVWLIDIGRGALRRLTFDQAIEGEPVFSPDGARVLFVSDGKANIWDMYERATDGTGSETLMLESGEQKNPRDWSADGSYILYVSQNPTTGFDLWALPVVGDRKPVSVATTPFEEFDGRFSKDGRWVAYTSTESGRTEIYLQPFPGPGPKSQISNAGGTSPRWSTDGRELFYVAPDNRLMSVAFSGSSSTTVAPPRALFALSSPWFHGPSRDGQRFLISTLVSEASPITIVLNWKPPAPTVR